MKLYIRLAREMAGLAQNELAERIGVSASTLNGYESGNHAPKPELLNRIADICEVSVDFLLGREDIVDSSPDPNKIEERIRELIISRYGDQKSFAEKCGMYGSTLSTILSRGFLKSAIGNVLTICDALDISMDALAHGEIAYRQDFARQNLSATEGQIISYMKQLNPDGQERLSEQAEFLVTSGKYRIDLPTAGNGGTRAV